MDMKVEPVSQVSSTESPVTKTESDRPVHIAHYFYQYLILNLDDETKKPSEHSRSQKTPISIKLQNAVSGNRPSSRYIH